jgi:hypothetical protein
MFGYINRKIHIERAISVKEYAYCEDNNKLFRDYMEDGICDQLL